MTISKEQRDKQRDRHAFIGQVYAYICDRLDQQAQLQMQEKIDTLIRRNCQLLGDVTYSFYRDGQLYHTGNLDRRRKILNGWFYTKLNLVLHPSLYGDCNKILKDHQEQLVYTKKAKDYAATILSRMPTLADVNQLIPSSYRSNQLDYFDLYDNGPALTYAELQEFRVQHREGEEIFMKLQLLEMIGAR